MRHRFAVGIMAFAALLVVLGSDAAEASAARDVRSAPHPRRRPRAETPTSSTALSKGPFAPPPASALERASPLERPSGPVKPSLVFDTDTRQLVTDTTLWPYKAVVWQWMTFPDGFAAWCSGTLVGARSVLTAGHCVYEAEHGWANSVHVIPGRNDIFWPVGDAWATSLHSVEGWTSSANADYDYALETLDRPIGDTTGWMTVAPLADSQLNALLIGTSGYPGDKGLGTQQYVAYGMVETYDSTMVYHKADTFGGQSGSGIHGMWAYSDIVFAVHSGSGWFWGSEYNRGPRITGTRSDIIYGWMGADAVPGDNLTAPYSATAFDIKNRKVADIPRWAAQGVKVASGDFDNDGRDDIAMLGPPSWGTVPIAFSRGDGSYLRSNFPLANFPGWASDYSAKLVAGDFNNDGRDDLALVGGYGWTTLPVAFSNGNGTFNVKNLPIGSFAAWASEPGVQAVAGDFDGDGFADIALAGGRTWTSVPVAFSRGDGTFRVTNSPIANFATWATAPGVKLVAADFDGDGRRTDLALTGPAGWGTIPVAYSNGASGTFSVVNVPVPNFPVWASDPWAKVVAGDFNGDSFGDIALVGGNGWGTAPIAFSAGFGAFTVKNDWVGPFTTWASEAYVHAVAGKMNLDGKSDIALVGGLSWWSVPTAFAR